MLEHGLRRLALAVSHVEATDPVIRRLDAALAREILDHASDDDAESLRRSAGVPINTTRRA